MQHRHAVAFPIVTAAGLPAGTVASLSVGQLAYVNRLAEACLLSPADRRASVFAAATQRSTVRARVGLPAAAASPAASPAAPAY